MTLVWIGAASLAGGAGAVLLTSLLLLTPERLRRAWISPAVAYATGTLLGAAFLGMIPHALEHLAAKHVMGTVLGGIVLFYALERLVLWRHCHEAPCDVHEAAAVPMLAGDAIHNAIDGVVIAAAFLESTPLGVAATIAVVAHEIPQEVGDFLVFIGMGWSPRRSFVANLLVSLTTPLGAAAAVLSLGAVRSAAPYLLSLSAASFIYVALADLVPGRRAARGPGMIALETALLVAGVASIALLHRGCS